MKVGIDNVNESPAQFHKFGVASAAAQSVRYFVLSAWIIVRLLISSILLFLEPIVGFILCTLAIVLAIVSVVLKLSGDVPKFPFWGALGVCVGLYLLFALYSFIAIWVTPKPHE